MEREYAFCLRLSGITVRFVTPTPIELPDNFQPFACPDTDRPDEEYRVERLRFDAFVPLFSQTILNSWDRDFMDRMADLFAELLDRVPVYRLYCRPDRQAVELSYHTLFGKEPTV